MPGDPTECREHARECERIANTASNEQRRETFQNLAKTWLRLANELEFSKALLDTWGDERRPVRMTVVRFSLLLDVRCVGVIASTTKSDRQGANRHRRKVARRGATR